MTAQKREVYQVVHVEAWPVCYETWTKSPCFKEKFGCDVLVLFLVWCCFELKTHRIGTVSNTHDKAGCVGFVLVLSGKPMCIGCLSLGACLLVENYSMKNMESSCSHVRNITCQTSAMTHTREAFAFQGKV